MLKKLFLGIIFLALINCGEETMEEITCDNQAPAQWELSPVFVYVAAAPLVSPTQKAIHAINEAGGCELITLSQYGTAPVTVNYGQIESPALASYLTIEGEGSCSMEHCKVTMNPDTEQKYNADLLFHELCHCLGLGHSDDPNSLLYWRYTGGQEVSEGIKKSLISICERANQVTITID